MRQKSCSNSDPTATLTFISNRDSKFLSIFWNTIFERLRTKLLLSIVYHSQTNDLFERINQTVIIVLKYLNTKYSEINWVNALSILQTNLNNLSNIVTKIASNEYNYEFKVRNVLFFLVKVTTSDVSILDDIRLRYRQKTQNTISFAFVKAKIYYDIRHQSLMMNLDDKVFLKLHRRYSLLKQLNTKLFNQRIESFLIKCRVDRLIYELNLFSQWKIHSMISIAYLESASFTKDSYERSRPTHSKSIHMKEDTENWKSYVIEKMMNKRQRRYEKTMITQYRIKWEEYDDEWNEWRSLAALNEYMNLMKNYERQLAVVKSRRERRELKRKKTNVTIS